MTTVYLYVTDTLADWEPAYVLAELHSGRFLNDPSRKYSIILCGLTLDTITTMGGLCLTPSIRFCEIEPGAEDLVLLPGADTWLDPRHGPVLEKVSSLLDKGIPTGAICGATMALAQAGILDSRHHTSNDLAALRMFCPAYRGGDHYRNEPAVTDKNLVTASGLAPVDFAYHIFRLLDVMNESTLEAWYQLYTTRRPEHFYALMQSLPGKTADP